MSGTFADHIVELRRRLVYIALVFVAGSGLAYSYHEILTRVIMMPLKGQKLVYLTPGGGFSFIFQISLYTGLVVAAPFIVYHLYAFIKPALPPQARRSAGKVVTAAVCLLSLGIAYGYFVAVPAALHFLAGFAGDAVTPNLTADSYLSFFLSYIGGLALLSLLPLFLVFWHWISPLKPGGLLKSERWIILLSFVAAAIITPTPDAANQAMIAGPVILLYQFGVIAVMISIHRQKRAQRHAMHPTDKQTEDDKKLDELIAAWPLETRSMSPQLQAASIADTKIDKLVTNPSSTTPGLDIRRPVRPSTLSAPKLAAPQIARPTPSNSPTTPMKRGSMDVISRSVRREVRRPTSSQQSAAIQTAAATARTLTPQPTPTSRQFSLDGIFKPTSAQVKATA